MTPPFEIYHRQVDIADANGHICTAENPEIAKEILAALSAAIPRKNEVTSALPDIWVLD